VRRVRRRGPGTIETSRNCARIGRSKLVVVIVGNVGTRVASRAAANVVVLTERYIAITEAVGTVDIITRIGDMRAVGAVVEDARVDTITVLSGAIQ